MSKNDKDNIGRELKRQSILYYETIMAINLTRSQQLLNTKRKHHQPMKLQTISKISLANTCQAFFKTHHRKHIQLQKTELQAPPRLIDEINLLLATSQIQLQGNREPLYKLLTGIHNKDKPPKHAATYVLNMNNPRLMDLRLRHTSHPPWNMEQFLNTNVFRIPEEWYQPHSKELRPQAQQVIWNNIFFLYLLSSENFPNIEDIDFGSTYYPSLIQTRPMEPSAHDDLFHQEQ
jgi:hypothetical protein